MRLEMEMFCLAKTFTLYMSCGQSLSFIMIQYSVATKSNKIHPSIPPLIHLLSPILCNLSKEAQKSLTEVFPGQQRDLLDMGLLLGLLLVGDSNWSHYFSHYPKPIREDRDADRPV